MTERQSVLTLFLTSLTITAALAAWMHGLRLDVTDRESVRIFLSFFLFDDYPAALLMLAALAFAVFPPMQRAAVLALSWAGARPWGLFVIVVPLLAVGSVLVYRAHPLAMDEYAAVFQSEAFSSGRVFGQFPPTMMDWLVPPGFQGHFLRASHQTGQVASMYWPGFAAILTPFTIVGLSWLANPVLGGLLVVLVHRLAFCVTQSVEAAGLAALLTLASPAVTVNAISFYSMTAHAVCNAAFVLLLLRPNAARAFAAGVIGSVSLVLHNPLPHILVATPWLLWLLLRSDRGRTVPAAILGYLPISILVGFGWLHLLAQIPIGSISSIAVPLADESFVTASFRRLAGVSVFQWPALDLLEDRLMAIAKLWLWAVPGLCLLAIAGAKRAKTDIRCRLMVWSAILTLFGYLFVPADQGHGWGFRYFHAVWFVLPVLAAVAVLRKPPAARDYSARPARVQLVGYVAACAVLSATVLTGLRAYQVHRFISGHLDQIPASTNGVAEVIFVRPELGYYAADLVQNDPFLRNRPLILISHGDQEDARLRREHFRATELLADGAVATVWGDSSHSPPARFFDPDPEQD
jgi:hypothetical protein